MMSSKNSKSVFSGSLACSATSHSQQPNDSLHLKTRSSVLTVLSRRLSDSQEIPEGEDTFTNSIIMEYLNWIGYRHSIDMLKKETRISNTSSSRSEQNELDVLRNKLTGTEVNTPLIFTLIFQNKK